MNHSRMLIAAAALAAAGIANAAPSAEEIKKLGTTLTAWGAEKAGNKEGTIPEYTGGVTNPPKDVDWKSGTLPDPYADDKVLFWIDAKNVDQYADKLSPGVQAMIKKWPATMRVAVYPSRRSASYPQDVQDNSVKNATRCSLNDGGDTLDVSKGCRGGFAFPIPKDGYEAMWNHATFYMGAARLRDSLSYMVKPSGESVMVNHGWMYEDNQLYDKKTPTPWRHWSIKSEYLGPTRLVGNANYYNDLLNNERKAWSYSSATKRTRLAPDLAADTPIAPTGGTMLYDQVNLFSGSLERFDWKLVGKKEMYIPYNNYNLVHKPSKECTPEGGLFTPNHPNPACIRFELHRVWHVEATLKQGKRHVFSKRDYYFDEDTWIGGLGEGFDHNGKLYIVQWTTFRPDYVKHAPLSNGDHANFDLNSGAYHFPIGVRAWVYDEPLRTLTSNNLDVFQLKPPID